MGEKRHINKIPTKIPGQSRENYVYVFFFVGVYHPFQNHYTHEITIFELLRLHLQLSRVFRIDLRYSYSFLGLLSE